MSSNTNYTLVTSTAQSGGVGVIYGGLYELADGFWHAAAPSCGPCPTDTDSDGDTDSADLAELLSDWGPVPPGNCLDADADGDLDSADLAEVLSVWGTCP